MTQRYGVINGTMEYVNKEFCNLIDKIKKQFKYYYIKQFIITESPRRCILSYVIDVDEEKDGN